MAFIPFKKSHKCVVADDLFLEVTWEAGKSPDEDSELLGIIEGLDQQYLDSFQHSLEESLPYVTFHQAELLFQSLQEAYGYIQLKKVAICHLEKKEAVSEGEVFASPFIIDQGYQNLLVPLIQSIMTSQDFQFYTYQEKREYFVNQIYPAYKASLGIQESALPLFPEEGEQILSFSPRQKQFFSEKTASSVEQKVSKKHSLKKVYLLMGLLGALALGGAITSAISYAHLTKQHEQLTYLNQELKSLQNLVNKEHQVDVFCRYFLPNYYSGNKENMVDFLSDGDAKYTVPKEGNLQSVILEDISYDSEIREYTVIYAISKKQDETVSNIRLKFSIQASESAKYGFVVTTEPIESDFNQNNE